ncbi:hypothetical protein LOK49_LG08G02833 [Camellia lanceoleosa]|uniref:Uncharacterized protein n=1 Tax=Camellia lanceoleosa TaxID=1840588 RepID=A0ACC0GRI4_9ERIC|nr:hypothetical protein LOK49_LG08G02833 [Camellia lanceoleosa]
MISSQNATGVPAAVLSSSSGFLHSSRAITSSMQHSSTTGFGSALNIETLVAAAERRDTSIEPTEISVNLEHVYFQHFLLPKIHGGDDKIFDVHKESLCRCQGKTY